MAVITPLEVSSTDIPLDLLSGGTAKPRIKVFIRAVSTGATDTITLQPIISDINKIMCINGESINGSTLPGTATQSSADGHTITTLNGSGDYDIECTVQLNHSSD